MAMYNLSIAKIIQEQQAVYGIITEMKEIVEQKEIRIILLKIQNLLIVKQKSQKDQNAKIKKRKLKLLYH